MAPSRRLVESYMPSWCIWSDQFHGTMHAVSVLNKVRCREGVLKHGGTNTTLPQVTEIYFWRWRLTSWCRPVLLFQILCINRQLDVQYRGAVMMT